MKLYYSASSPFVRKVMVLLHETCQLDDVTLVDISVTPVAPSDALRAANPLSKVPALDRTDGPALYDSRVICAYLDDRAQAGLYRSGAERWDMMTLEATADGIMDAALSARYEVGLRPAELQWQDWLEGQWSKMAIGVGTLERLWMAHLAKPLNIGHIAVGCALGYLDLRHADRDWRASAPALADWYAGFSARPSMVATAPPQG
ncbi:MAG: glutathione S-transferase [Marinibacterium sp.]|nr:glutathione S-transferase [Marinibacterium sp.]